MSNARDISKLAPVTPWTTLQLASGFTASSGMTPQYRISGDCIQFRGRFVATAAPTSGTPVQFASMPVGARPPFNQQSTMAPVAASAVALMVAFTTGVLNLLPYGSFPAGQAFDINSNYYFT